MLSADHTFATTQQPIPSMSKIKQEEELTPQQKLNLCNLVSRGYTVAEARKRLGLVVSAPVKTEEPKKQEPVKQTPAKVVTPSPAKAEEPKKEEPAKQEDGGLL